jgi:hypothetical protein
MRSYTRIEEEVETHEVFYNTMLQTDTNTETGGCMYGEGLLMMSA